MIIGLRSSSSMKLSAWRRSSSATIGGWVRMVETTLTRRPFFCTASTSRRKSPSPEKMHDVIHDVGQLHHVDGELDVHVAFDARRPWLSVNSLSGLVTTAKPL